MAPGARRDSSAPAGVAMDNAGNIYVADSGNHTIRKVTSGGVVTTLAGLAGSHGSVDGTGSAARFYQPEGVAVDSAGNIFVADSLSHIIRKITSGGVVTLLAGTPDFPGSVDGTGSAAQFFAPGAWRWTARATFSLPIPITIAFARLPLAEW